LPVALATSTGGASGTLSISRSTTPFYGRVFVKPWFGFLLLGGFLVVWGNTSPLPTFFRWIVCPSVFCYSRSAWQNGVGRCWRATQRGIAKSGRVNEPARGLGREAAAEARFFCHSFVLRYLGKLTSVSGSWPPLLHGGGRLSSLSSPRISSAGDWRLPGFRRDRGPATTFYPRRPKAEPDAVCVEDAFGKPGEEADPSSLRRAKLLPGRSTVRSPSPDARFPWLVELSFLWPMPCDECCFLPPRV